MTERPILFSAEMVRAILKGDKTQTRRVMKPQPSFNSGGPILDYGGGVMDEVEPHWVLPKICKYGDPGDLLWVRETWKLVPASAYRASEGVHQTSDPNDRDHAAIYRAGWDRSSGGLPWRPSIHMPRWASRITLRITDVRVERLQDISEDDARAEGWPGPITETGFPIASPLAWFANVWTSINGAGAWEANPWVWALSFERVKP
jgi:hypothetical protein